MLHSYVDNLLQPIVAVKRNQPSEQSILPNCVSMSTPRYGERTQKSNNPNLQWTYNVHVCLLCDNLSHNYPITETREALATRHTRNLISRPPSSSPSGFQQDLSSVESRRCLWMVCGCSGTRRTRGGTGFRRFLARPRL
jgi:hypothetical protein